MDQKENKPTQKGKRKQESRSQHLLNETENRVFFTDKERKREEIKQSTIGGF